MKLTKLALFALVAFWAVLVGLPELAHAAAPPPGPSVGKVLTNLHVSISRVPNILTTIAFIGGIVLAVTGVLKLKTMSIILIRCRLATVLNV